MAPTWKRLWLSLYGGQLARANGTGSLCHECEQRYSVSWFVHKIPLHLACGKPKCATSSCTSLHRTDNHIFHTPCDISSFIWFLLLFAFQRCLWWLCSWELMLPVQTRHCVRMSTVQTPDGSTEPTGASLRCLRIFLLGLMEWISMGIPSLPFLLESSATCLNAFGFPCNRIRFHLWTRKPSVEWPLLLTWTWSATQFLHLNQELLPKINAYQGLISQEMSSQLSLLNNLQDLNISKEFILFPISFPLLTKTPSLEWNHWFGWGWTSTTFPALNQKPLLLSITFMNSNSSATGSLGSPLECSKDCIFFKNYTFSETKLMLLRMEP